MTKMRQKIEKFFPDLNLQNLIMLVSKIRIKFES